MASLFSIDGERYLVAAGQRSRQPHDWIVFDLEKRSSSATRLELGKSIPPLGVSIYGSMTRDTQGEFYLGGTATREGGNIPVLFRVRIPRTPAPRRGA